MAGGPTTTEPGAFTAARAGALGFLAAGYKTAKRGDGRRDHRREAPRRSETPSGHVFVPGNALIGYAALPPATGLARPGLGDRQWAATGSAGKSRPCSRTRPRPPLHLGGPPTEVINRALQDAGSAVVITVTSARPRPTMAARLAPTR